MTLDDRAADDVDDAASEESSVLSDNMLSDDEGEDEATLVVNSSPELNFRSSDPSDSTNVQKNLNEDDVEPVAKRKKIALAKPSEKKSTSNRTKHKVVALRASDEKKAKCGSEANQKKVTRRKPEEEKTRYEPAQVAWFKECNLSVKEGKLAWNALDPSEQKRITERLSKKKFTGRVVPKVCGMRILGPGPDLPEPKKFSIRSKEGKELFTKTLMQSGWKVEAFSNKITYWSPGVPPIAFTSISQIANTFPSLLPK